MDSKLRNSEYIRDSEKVRDLLLGKILDRARHAAGTQFASAVRVCIDRRQWRNMEEWETQKTIRQLVLEPLGSCCV